LKKKPLLFYSFPKFNWFLIGCDLQFKSLF